MARTIFSFMLVFYTLTGFGQRRNLALIIDVPQGNKLILHAYAQGVQTYTCTQDAADTTHYTWTLVTPRAVLYTDSTYKHSIGDHYFNPDKAPTWAGDDGSKVSGNKLQQYIPSDGKSIPWLLLKATATSGTGVLTPVTFIQRIRTTGGKAPATATSAQKGQTIEVKYTAEYLFWGKE